MNITIGRATLGAVLLVGCGESHLPPADTPSTTQRSTTCTARVTGAITATAACPRGSLIHSKQFNTFSFLLDPLEEEPIVLQVRTFVRQKPETGTFTGPSESVDCGVFISSNDRRWDSAHEVGSQTGSCTLTLTAIAAADDGTSNFPVYWAWGTMRARLMELDPTEGSGSVEVELDFSE
ncbi:hypothetical protein MVI01_52080 [Myxococcus virescens]|uniref:Lipoprotein n=1 Tax=Myxococcus virescens TaxID=83456 RepID=A0A511HJ70_9BACT|nr:hypothetical protein MVI01_52080 [Myxococcus virescens]